MTSPVDIRPDHLEIVQGILREHLPGGVKVWVFGSRADWTTKDSSDLDLALESKSKLDRKVLGALADAFEDSDLPYTVDIVDINRVSDDFRQIVESQRMPLRGWKTTNYINWKNTTLGDCVVINDDAYSPKEEWRTMPFSRAVVINPRLRLERGETYPFVSMAAVDPNSHWAYADGQREYSSGGARFQDGDTLMARITPCLENGKIARYRSTNGSDAAYGSTEFVVIRGRAEVTDNQFAYYLTQSPAVRNYAISQMTGTSGRQRVPTSALDHIDVLIPSIKEQRRIAHILGTLDDRIELNRRMNATLEDMARTLFKSWFVDFEPVRAKMDGRWRRGESLPGMPADLYDLFPERLVPSSLGEVPEGWEVGVLDDAIELLSGGTPKTAIAEYWNGTILWYTAKDAPSLSDVFVVDTERKITQAGIDNSSTRMLPAGTTIITARGTVGRLACLGIPMTMNQTCYGIRGVEGYPDYFTYWNIRMTVGELQRRTHGTIFDTITRQTFKSVDAILPPPSLAEPFENAVLPTMNRILSNLNEVRSLAALRDSLLPGLVSGEFGTQ